MRKNQCRLCSLLHCFQSSTSNLVAWIFARLLWCEVRPSSRISSSVDKTIRIWDLNALTCIRKIKCYQPARCFVFLSSGELVSGYQDHRIDIWDLKKYCHLKSFRDHNLRVVNSMVESNRWSVFLNLLLILEINLIFLKDLTSLMKSLYINLNLMLKILESIAFSHIF